MNRPLVGTAVIAMSHFDGDCYILLGKRTGSHQSGTWAFPGGHLEYGESFKQCVRRESKEEFDIELGPVSFLTAVNDIMPEGKHYVTVWMTAVVTNPTKARIMEPDKFTEFGWFKIYDLEDWPKPLMACTENLIKEYGFSDLVNLVC